MLAARRGERVDAITALRQRTRVVMSRRQMGEFSGSISLRRRVLVMYSRLGRME